MLFLSSGCGFYIFRLKSQNFLGIACHYRALAISNHKTLVSLISISFEVVAALLPSTIFCLPAETLQQGTDARFPTELEGAGEASSPPKNHDRAVKGFDV
jgi:hypothetical protein